jgi:hypothetical protein
MAAREERHVLNSVSLSVYVSLSPRCLCLCLCLSLCLCLCKRLFCCFLPADWPFVLYGFAVSVGQHSVHIAILLSALLVLTRTSFACVCACTFAWACVGARVCGRVHHRSTGPDVTAAFCEHNDIKMIVRAHQVLSLSVSNPVPPPLFAFRSPSLSSPLFRPSLALQYAHLAVG